MPRNEPRFVLYYTLKLYERDRELLRKLADCNPDVPDRYHALKDLIPIVEELDMEDIRGERRALRLGIPVELDEVIKAKQRQTGQPYVQILVKAAHKYRERLQCIQEV